jgi:ferrochelatase
VRIVFIIVEDSVTADRMSLSAAGRLEKVPGDCRLRLESRMLAHLELRWGALAGMATFIGSTEQQGHQQPETTAVVLVNLGTPDAPTAPALRRYLAEFLSDPRVVETPRWLWWLILHGVILRIRPARSARAYATVWTEQGSPLLVGSRALTDAVRAQLQSSLGAEAPSVALAMSYGSPNLRDVLEDLRRRGMRRLLVVPLYPQYSGSTTASVFDAVSRQLQRWRWLPELRFVTDYYREPGYAQALAASVREHWQRHGRGERLLLSFHGIPGRYLVNGDPYYCQCQATARLMREALGLGEEEVFVSFQSRVGREPWLQPYTDQTLQAWAKAGVRRVDVACPGFSIDCLETLEEIAEQNAEAFVHAGGERLSYIPALNHRPDHVTMLGELIERHLQGWPAASAVDASRAARVSRTQAEQTWLKGVRR